VVGADELRIGLPGDFSVLGNDVRLQMKTQIPTPAQFCRRRLVEPMRDHIAGVFAAAPVWMSMHSARSFPKKSGVAGTMGASAAPPRLVRETAGVSGPLVLQMASRTKQGCKCMPAPACTAICIRR